MSNPETKTVTLTKTIKSSLQTSDKKNNRVQEAVDEWQQIASHMANLVPSFPPHRWSAQDTQMSRIVKRDFPNHSLRAHEAYQAAYKVAEAYNSWKSNGKPGNKPRFGEGNYVRLCHCGVNLSRNNKGYGVKLGLAPYSPEWFHVQTGQYQARHFEEVLNGDMGTGSAELHLKNNGDLVLHLTISKDIEVPKKGEHGSVVGVDLGENVLYSAATVNKDGEVVNVGMESGKEFRHHRERLKRRKKDLMKKSDLQGLKDLRNEHRRYTDHVTHVISKKVVEHAEQAPNPVIKLEDLKHYRETNEKPIHDWPFAETQEKIGYKALEAGIPVETVDASYTSLTCNKCGLTSKQNRDGHDFKCIECGYEVHADVNAAINIGSK